MLLHRIAIGLSLSVALIAQQPRPSTAKARSKSPAAPRTTQPARSAEESAARALLASMSLRDRVAQMVIGVANGEVFSTESEDYKKFQHWIADLHIGGIIVNNTVEFGSARNANPFAMAVFLNQMQRLSRVPLIIGSDFEQGASMRVTGGTQFPHSMAFGAGGDISASRYEGRITAREARALGVHWVFAPVSDVNNNPANPVINIRAYGEDPEQVSQHVAAYIQGAHSDPNARVLVTAKHFPGHGDVSVDSHYGLPRLDVPRARMDEMELKPFRAAIISGVDSIMTAHMAVPELDSTGVPATVSATVLTGILRDELQFRNLIVTDAMNMQGLTDMFSNAEASVRTVVAGADVLLMPPDPEQSIRAVVAAVEAGRIPRKRIDESALRILIAKVSLGLMRNKLVDVNEIANVLASPEAAARAQEIADRSVTLLRNDHNILPLSPASHPCLVLINSLRISQQGQRVLRDFRRKAPQVQYFTVDTTMPFNALEAEVAQAKDCSVIVIANFAGITSNMADMNKFIEKVTDGPVPVVLASFNDPYMGGRFAKAAAYLTPFSSAPPSEVAAVKAIFGEIEITGKTPVSIPQLAPLGAGIHVSARTQQARRAR
ncbi:MAG: glycoside hydrolase family 3 protein, partial [Acidobacteriota bacterium]